MNSPLIGCWKLVSYELRSSTGRVVRPFGDAPVGRLMYDAHGRMIGQCLDPRREKFARSNPTRGTALEIRAAFNGCVGYFGTYTLDKQARTVTHHVKGSLFPNWIGSDQARHYEIRGRRLVLRTPPIKTSKREVVGVLVWEREE